MGDGKVEWENYELETHQCTEEELGLASDNPEVKPAFMPIEES